MIGKKTVFIYTCTKDVKSKDVIAKKNKLLLNLE